eukprot:m51a1_g14709 hypothetical protein (128) ;mRNA; f:152216-153264
MEELLTEETLDEGIEYIDAASAAHDPVGFYESATESQDRVIEWRLELLRQNLEELDRDAEKKHAEKLRQQGSSLRVLDELRRIEEIANELSRSEAAEIQRGRELNVMGAGTPSTVVGRLPTPDPNAL